MIRVSIQDKHMWAATDVPTRLSINCKIINSVLYASVSISEYKKLSQYAYMHGAFIHKFHAVSPWFFLHG